MTAPTLNRLGRRPLRGRCGAPVYQSAAKLSLEIASHVQDATQALSARAGSEKTPAKPARKPVARPSHTPRGLTRPLLLRPRAAAAAPGP